MCYNSPTYVGSNSLNFLVEFGSLKVSECFYFGVEKEYLFQKLLLSFIIASIRDLYSNTST